MLWVWILIGLLITIGIALLAMTIDIKNIFHYLLNGARKTKSTVDERVNSDKNSKLVALLKYTEEMIINSNIRLYLPYSVFSHLILCIIAAYFTFNWINQYMGIFISTLFSVLGFVFPFIILEFLAEFILKRIKSYSVDFLVILKNFFVATGDIFRAFEKTKCYSIEPLKSFIGIMMYEYKHKVSPEVCIENFSNRVGDPELRLFLDNLQIAYKSGSDIEMLIAESINEIERQNEDSDKEDAEDKILSTGLYILLLINFSVVYFILNSSFSSEVTGTIWGQTTFILDILISLFIIYSTIKK